MTARGSISPKLFLVFCALVLVLSLASFLEDRGKAVPNYVAGGIQVTGTYTRQELEEIVQFIRTVSRDEVQWVTVPLDERIAFTKGDRQRLSTEMTEVYTYAHGSRISGSVYRLKKTDGAWRVIETSLWIR
jgi:hypothetical protein